MEAHRVYLKPALGSTGIIIAGQQYRGASSAAFLKQHQLGVKGALTQAGIHSHCCHWAECIHIVLHTQGTKLLMSFGANSVQGIRLGSVNDNRVWHVDFASLLKGACKKNTAGSGWFEPATI